MGRMTWPSILNLLLFDESNPRSIMFQVAGIHGYLLKLAAVLDPRRPMQIEPLLGEIRDVGRTVRNGADYGAGQRAQLLTLLRRLRGAAYQLSDELTERFFAHAEREISAMLAI